MIIVLDSSALTRGARFDTAIADARALGHRVVVPRLVVLEVASRYREESAEMIAALSVQARMYDRLGLRRDLTRFVDAAHDKADGYVDDVIEDLVAIGVEVVDPVDVSHLEVAERAISLRRPYVDKKKRDGYPATLNWLTVLDLADRNPGVDVIWVSSDARAYGDGEDGVWHGDLAHELAARGLEYRVRWASDIPVIDGPVQVEEVAEVAPEAPQIVQGFLEPEAVVPAEIPEPVASVAPAAPAVAPAPKPVQRAARTRVAPQRIEPAPKAQSGGLRGLGKVIGGRKRKVTIVDDLDEVDLFGA
ncbi:PIN domain-containing protein [Rhodococcus sp. IEGM 1409]|uniref:PIN domain-containing protein n=1 Tax=Rhodococcus sp. IEGM 1409 TaxID=3047082 RepID=UPI0024B7803A|nr:PIN domain-containing protein [Rhodococcus sp. IEGM 1409]MDI9902772.1 PIN domain-containing protein [Rhodococcus sp. IEGM 1409]